MARRVVTAIALAAGLAGGGLALACGAVFDLSVLGSGGDAGGSGDVGAPDSAAPDAADAGPIEEDSSAPCVADGGGPMKRIGVYCIDSAEVTVRDYETFLANVVDAGGGASTHRGCETATDRIPSDPDNPWAPTAFTRDLPVSGVTFCDADAFCASVGKRLCGKRGGGSLTPAPVPVTDKDTNEWYRACSKAGAYLFPQGNQPPPGECATTNELRPKSVGCEGGYLGIFDMVGNVEEWIDACDSDDADANCIAAGGSALDDKANCTTAKLFFRTGKRPLAGIRCCAD